MNKTEKLALFDRQIERSNSLILAAEDWAKGYSKAPEQHAKLIKLESRMETLIRNYFRELSLRVSHYINWHEYRQKVVQASFKVNVLVQEDTFDEIEQKAFFKVMHDPIQLALTIGAQAGEIIYKKDLGLSPASQAIQQAARNETADLVTKVSDVTKERISQAIETSIRLGEDQQATTDRLGSVISDPRRAGTIARTESVNGYQKGLTTFAKQSGAVGHEWQDVDAIDECAENADEGIIGIDEAFSSGDFSPPAHPNCKCDRRLVYQVELDANDDSIE